MNSRHRIGLVALAGLTGCSLIFSTNSVLEPCDPTGNACLPGFVCSSGLCKKADGGGIVGCASATQDTDCPAGACGMGNICDNGLLAWQSGAGNTPVLSCFANYPPAPADAGLYPLSGCITALPGDVLPNEPWVFLGVDGGQGLVGVSGACSGGYDYTFAIVDGGVPVGQFFEVDVYTDAGSYPVRTTPVFVSAADADGGVAQQRNVFAISPARLAELLGELDAGPFVGDAGPLGGGTLVLGVVEDCNPGTDFSGGQLSGVHVVVQNLRQPVFYLGPAGDVIPGRVATDPTGVFASYLPSSQVSNPLVSLTYFQALSDGGLLGFGPPLIDGGTAGVVALGPIGPGVLWVPLAPAGP